MQNTWTFLILHVKLLHFILYVANQKTVKLLLLLYQKSDYDKISNKTV